MTRLIDADALTDDILKSAVMIDDTGIQTGYEIAIELIKRQPTIDAVPLDGSFLKMSRDDYLIYKRHWLYEHFDMEMEIQRSAMKSMGYEYVGKNTDAVRHGKWIEMEEVQNCHDINGYETWGIKYMCETCGFKTIAIEGHFAQYKYCPQCGARMDKQ